MSSLQKMLSEIREVDGTEIDEVGGGEFYDSDAVKTTNSYTDSHGVTHSVTNYD